MVNAKAMMKALRLTELAPAPTEELRIEASDMNRPGLQLSGFWEHFAYERPQILGLVETSYLRSLEPAIRQERLERFVSYDLPCIIICRHLAGMDDLIDMARARSIPVYRSDSDTTQLIVELIYYLNGALAPSTRMHGVLVEIYGVGVLITGNSGVGKSEAALELLKRGHRLVADDAVDIRRVSAGRLVGQAPEMVRNFMEIRGIGIINVATLFGIGSVMQSKSIDMVVHLEHWQQDKEYDRLGLTDAEDPGRGRALAADAHPAGTQPGRGARGGGAQPAPQAAGLQRGEGPGAALQRAHGQRLQRERLRRLTDILFLGGIFRWYT